MAVPSYRNSRRRFGIKIITAVLGVFGLVLAVISFFMWSADQKTLEKTGQPDFNTLVQEDLKDGLIVKGDIGLVFGTYAEQYETKFGERSFDDSEVLYYIIPVYDKNPDGTISPRYCITYEAMPDEFEMMERLSEQSAYGLAYITPMTVENARIKYLPEDIRQFLFDDGYYEGGSFADFCAEYNMFGTADRRIIASKLVPYMISKTSTAGFSLTTVWVFLGISVFSFTIMLIMTFVKKPIKGIDPPTNDEFRKIHELGGE